MRLEVAGGPAGSRLAGLRQEGSLKALFPRREAPGLEAVFLNTAGGLTGGDHLRIAAIAGPGARVALSSQAAERGYRSGDGSAARVDVVLEAAEGARLDWMPQETLLYDGASLRRRLTLTLGEGARALIVEPLVLGRTSMGETVRSLRLSDRWEVWRDGRTLFADAVRIDGDAAAQFDQAAIAGGARAMASVLLAGPGVAALLVPVRAVLPRTAGASLVQEDLLFVRGLAADGFALRRWLCPVIEGLSGGALPKVWRL